MHDESSPFGLPFCACGCGERVARPMNRYIKAHMTGRRHPNFKGDRTVVKEGRARVHVWIDDEMKARLGVTVNRALRSRVNWLLAHPGETLTRDEPIHHVNGDTMDDRPENLQKMASNRDHILQHADLTAAMNARRPRRPERFCEVCGVRIRSWQRFCSFACRGVGQRGAANVNYRNARQASARLTEAQVVEIRRRYRPRIVTAAMLAAEYGVAVSTMEKILRGVHWPHVS